MVLSNGNNIVITVMLAIIRMILILSILALSVQ
jgi:hypothetical protein